MTTMKMLIAFFCGAALLPYAGIIGGFKKKLGSQPAPLFLSLFLTLLLVFFIAGDLVIFEVFVVDKLGKVPGSISDSEIAIMTTLGILTFLISAFQLNKLDMSEK